MKKIFKRLDIILTIVVFLIMIPIEKLEWFSTLENQTLSLRHILRMHYGDPEVTGFAKDKVAIVYLNEKFFEEYHSFPLRRADVGTIVENLRKLGAKVVVVDMLMDYSSSYNEDPIISNALKSSGGNILVSMLVIKNDKIVGIQYPTQLIKNATQTAYSNHTKSGSMLNRLRTYPEAVQLYNEWPTAVKSLAMYMDTEPTINKNLLTIGDLKIHLDHFGDFRTDFPALAPDTRFLHLDPEVGIFGLDILDLDWDDQDMVAELQYMVEGKIVFLGDTSEVSHDIFDTIVGEVYGVEIMADEVSTMIKGAPLRAASDTLEAVQIVVFMLLLIALHFINDPKFRYSGLFVLFAGYIGLATYAYIFWHIDLSMSYLLSAATLGFVFINTYIYIQERKQKSFITGAFGQYLSPAVIDILVKDPSKLSLGGERREMTAYFSDIQGFSTISESLTPEELVQLLNEYLTEMCNIIGKYNGTVDKFEGDAIIAFWGAPLIQPDHAILCCHASIDMQAAMVEMRKTLQAAGRPILNVRMGINTGQMVVGNMGSQSRMDYTMMGDAVNLAARLEGANKFYKNYSMISQFTYEKAKDHIDTRELDLITVVGKDEPIKVYDLVEKKGKTSGMKADLVAQYLLGLEAYKQRDFQKALVLFEKALTILPTDGPSITYVERCKKLIQEPPKPDWDGVWKLTEKG